MTRLLLSALLTLGAGLLAALIRLRSPLVLGSDETAIFLAEPAGLVAPWAIGLALIWLFPRRGAGRAAKLAFALLAGVALLAPLVAAIRSGGRPERLTLAELEAPEANGRRTLLVGVDALSWNRLLPLVRQGRLPNFERLMREGGYGVLRSHRALRRSVGKSGYWSPVVWTSLATGVSSDKHGITDFSLPTRDGGLTLAASHHRRTPAFWNLFSAFGRRVGVVGWWASWPAEEVNGVVASSGLGLRGRREGRGSEIAEEVEERFQDGLTYPPELVAELEQAVRSPTDTRRFIDERLFPLSSYPVLGEGETNTFESVIWQDRYFYNVARYLATAQEFDLLAVYLEGIDSAAHLFWRYADDPGALVSVTVPDGFIEHGRVVDRYYGVVDGFLGGLLERVGDETTVIVCSDHGFASDPEHEKGADHSPFGALLVRGEGIRPGRDLDLSPGAAVTGLLRDRVDVFDLLPTLLYLHGLPISDELDGRVLYELFERSYLARHPEVRVSTYGDFARTRKVEPEVPEEQREEYLERLRSLGYVD